MARKISSNDGCFSMYSTFAGGNSFLSSSRVPLAMIFPPCRMAMRSERCSASSSCWVVSRIVVPLPASSLTVLQTSSRASGSSPVVGSSRKITAGVPTRLIAMSSRRAIPPEYEPARRVAAELSPKRESNVSAVLRASETPRSLAISTRFSRPVRMPSTAANCPVRLMRSRTFAD